MSDISDAQWDRLRAAWLILHPGSWPPGSWPDRGMMIDDAISAMECYAASLYRSESQDNERRYAI